MAIQVIRGISRHERGTDNKPCRFYDWQMLIFFNELEQDSWNTNNKVSQRKLRKIDRRARRIEHKNDYKAISNKERELLYAYWDRNDAEELAIEANL